MQVSVPNDIAYFSNGHNRYTNRMQDCAKSHVLFRFVIHETKQQTLMLSDEPHVYEDHVHNCIRKKIESYITFTREHDQRYIALPSKALRSDGEDEESLILDTSLTAALTLSAVNNGNRC